MGQGGRCRGLFDPAERRLGGREGGVGGEREDIRL